jgi:hypothetical protein
VRQATAKDRDVLAIAEAILKEKEGSALSDGELQTLSRAIRAVDEAEAVLEKERSAARMRATTEEAKAARQPVAEEPIDLLAQAEALLTAKDASLGKVKTEYTPPEAPAIEAEAAHVEASAEPLVAGEVELVKEEEAPEIKIVPELPPAPGLDWVEIEEEEEDESGIPRKDKKKEQKGKKRELIFDENLGEVVARRKHKPSRRRYEWEDEEY